MPDKIKKLFASNIQVGSRPNLDALRALARNNPNEFADTIRTLADSGEMALGTFRMRDAFAALCDIEVPARMVIAGQERAIMAGAFPLLTGGLVVAGINAAYQRVPTIGQLLVEEMEDPKKVTTIASVHALDKSQDEVREGDAYPEIGASEEKVEIRHKRNGRTLSITAEAIEENEIADIVTRVNALGELAADWVEELTLSRVCDAKGSATTSGGAPYVYRPNGTGTAIYNSTANNPGTRAPSGTRVTNNALVDETDLDNARAVLAAMKNNAGRRIAIPMSESVLLVPDALASTAAKLLNSEYVPGVENEVNNWGPRGQWRPKLVTSPKLDDISTSAWYLGAFQRQFVRKWKLRFEYVTLSGNTKDFLERRIAFQARIGWDVEVGATDYVHVVQSLASTTYVPTNYAAQ